MNFELSRDLIFWYCSVPIIWGLISLIGYNFFFADRVKRWEEDAKDLDEKIQGLK